MELKLLVEGLAFRRVYGASGFYGLGIVKFS